MAEARPVRMPEFDDDPRRIVEYVNRTIWDAYQELRQPWLRQVETNVRNLAGQQYTEYVPQLGGFVDLAQVFLSQDDQWRSAPVFNWLGQHWFQLGLAKLTENIPTLGSMPATSDQTDAQSAAIFDPFYRYYWSYLGMPELMFPLYGWVLTAGEAVLKSRWDPDEGEPWQYQPDPSAVPDQTPKAPGPLPPTLLKTGDLACEVICPAAVLYPYGPFSHWRAPWVMHEYLIHVDEARDRWGMQNLQPDPVDPRNDLLVRLQYTSFYGNSGSPGGGFQSAWGGSVAVRDMVRVRERWERACRYAPYGRLTLVTREQVLSDDINPYVVPGVRENVVIPFNRFPRPSYPFRQEGASDLENLIPLARERNRALAGCGDFVAHNEQPTLFYNRNLVPDDQVENLHRVGGKVGTDGDPNAAAAYLNVPQMPMAGQQWAQLLLQELQVLGHTANAEATVPNDARSGELLEQNRFDTDRPWGATLRLHSREWARTAETWFNIAAACMEDTRVLSIAGEDQLLGFVTVRPDLMAGRINVYAMPDNAILETPEGKQQRLAATLGTAAQLMQVNPQWANTFLSTLGYNDLLKFRPGGEAVALARRQVAEMVQTGQLAPVYPEQDHAAHVQTVVEFMQGQAFRDLPEPGKVVLRLYKAMHEMAGQQQLILEASKQAQVMEGAAAAAGLPGPSMMAERQMEQEDKAAARPPLKRVK